MKNTTTITKTFNSESQAENFYMNLLNETKFEGKRIRGVKWNCSCAANNFADPTVEIEVLN